MCRVLDYIFVCGCTLRKQTSLEKCGARRIEERRAQRAWCFGTKRRSVCQTTKDKESISGSCERCHKKGLFGANEIEKQKHASTMTQQYLNPRAAPVPPIPTITRSTAPLPANFQSNMSTTGTNMRFKKSNNDAERVQYWLPTQSKEPVKNLVAEIFKEAPSNMHPTSGPLPEMPAMTNHNMYKGKLVPQEVQAKQRQPRFHDGTRVASIQAKQLVTYDGDPVPEELFFGWLEGPEPEPETTASCSNEEPVDEEFLDWLDNPKTTARKPPPLRLAPLKTASWKTAAPRTTHKATAVDNEVRRMTGQIDEHFRSWNRL